MGFSFSLLLSLIAFLGVTAAPIAVAVGCWAMSNRLKHWWIAHVVAAPAIIGVEFLFTKLLLLAGQTAGEGAPDLGFAATPGRYLTLLALGGYAVAAFLSTRERLREAARERRSQP